MRNVKLIRITLVKLVMPSFFLFPQSFCTYLRQQIAPSTYNKIKLTKANPLESTGKFYQQE